MKLTTLAFCAEHTHPLKERFQVTLHPVLVKHAYKEMDVLGFSSFSEYLEHLIREATLARAKVLELHDAPAGASQVITRSASYAPKRKRAG